MQTCSEFWALDFDRCLGNAAEAIRTFETVAAHTDPRVDVALLESARADLELAGGTFDMLGYIRDTVGDENSFMRIIAAFQEAAKERVTALQQPGSRQIVAYLADHMIPHGIVSYGHSDWQVLKIEASGFGDLPRLIVETSRKGELIQGWKDEESSFVIPAELTPGYGQLRAQHVVLVDDKAVSFTGLPEGARGYWVRDPLLLLASQKGTIPSSVVAVQSLSDIPSHEENI